MITINSFLHRRELDDIIRRWMYDEARPADAELITRLVHFNHVYLSRYLQTFADELFQRLHGGEFSVLPVQSKGELKDALIADPPYQNDRIGELIADYRRNPGRYYRETPFRGNMYFHKRDSAHRLVGCTRIKRVRRLAEKAARRIIDRIFMTIKLHAEDLARERARLIGVRPEELITSPSDMTEEFLKAEGRLVEDLRLKRPLAAGNDKPLAINDVAGVKVILEDEQQDRLRELLAGLPGCAVAEEERHRGLYNAVNFIVRYRPDKKRIISLPLNGGVLKVMRGRGFSPAEANSAFADFVLSGEEEVLLEIIMSNYQETLESEIGRCIHEDRIIAQRLHQPYRGPLARNIQYLMEYLFTFPNSREPALGELPIKLWNRYLPDYFDEVLKKLFGIPTENDRD